MQHFEPGPRETAAVPTPLPPGPEVPERSDPPLPSPRPEIPDQPEPQPEPHQPELPTPDDPNPLATPAHDAPPPAPKG